SQSLFVGLFLAVDLQLHSSDSRKGRAGLATSLDDGNVILGRKRYPRRGGCPHPPWRSEAPHRIFRTNARHLCRASLGPTAPTFLECAKNNRRELSVRLSFHAFQPELARGGASLVLRLHEDCGLGQRGFLQCQLDLARAAGIAHGLRVHGLAVRMTEPANQLGSGGWTSSFRDSQFQK